MSEQRDIKERSFEFAVRIAAACGQGATPPIQALFRAGAGIGLRVEEAHGHLGKPEFTANMAAAAKEARETAYWLRLLSAGGATGLDSLLDEATQLLAILTTIVRRSRSSQGF